VFGVVMTAYSEDPTSLMARAMLSPPYTVSAPSPLDPLVSLITGCARKASDATKAGVVLSANTVLGCAEKKTISNSAVCVDLIVSRTDCRTPEFAVKNEFGSTIEPPIELPTP
jgi:hypothetical protein